MVEDQSSNKDVNKIHNGERRTSIDLYEMSSRRKLSRQSESSISMCSEENYTTSLNDSSKSIGDHRISSGVHDFLRRLSRRQSGSSRRQSGSSISMHSNQTLNSTDEIMNSVIGRERHPAKSAEMKAIFSGHVQSFSAAILEKSTGDINSIENFNGGIHELLDQRNQRNAKASLRRASLSAVDKRTMMLTNTRKAASSLTLNSDYSAKSCPTTLSLSQSRDGLHGQKIIARKMDDFSIEDRNSSLCSIVTTPSKKLSELSVPEENEGFEKKKIDNSELGNATRYSTLTSTTCGNSEFFDSMNKKNNTTVESSPRKIKKFSSVPFFVALAVIFGGIIFISSFFIHNRWEGVSKQSRNESFRVIEENIKDMADFIHNELTEKIGLQATAMFSFPEQTFKRHVNAVRDGLYDPVRDRYRLVHDMIRAQASTSYASIAYESGFYLATGQMTINMSTSNKTGKTFEEYMEIEKRMEWLNSYNQTVLKCPENAFSETLGDGTTIIPAGKRGYVLRENIHWTQALVENNGSLPSEGLTNGTLECRDQNGNVLNYTKGWKTYSGWFQSAESESFIDATEDQGVGQPAFAYAELWGVREPPGHFENQTFETYNFSEPMWPDNNRDGRHTIVEFQNSSGMPHYGLTYRGVDNIMYNSSYDTRKRQWYQRGKELYDANPVPPRGHEGFHNQIISWFPLYVWQGENPTLAVGLTSPLYGPKDEFAGVITIDITVKTISRFLNQQTYGKSGVGYAIRPEKYFHSHGGVGIDEYVNMTYNNHNGTLLGVSRGSDHGKACGNDYTNNLEYDQHGPHYFVDETEWFNNETEEIRDHTNLTEMVLPIANYNKGGWICRLKIAKAINASISNRALPAENHEDPLISKSARHIVKSYGGFDKLIAIAPSGNAVFKDDDGEDEYFLQWTHLTSLEFPGFRPLIVVVVPKCDYLSEVLSVNEEAEENIKTTGERTMVGILVSIVITTICSIVVALVITMPLKRLNNEFMKLARLDIDEKSMKYKPSFIYEIASIQNSFRGMKMGLASFSKFVPYAVVKRIVGGDVSATKLCVERRNVTVMFADIANFTSFVESWPLECVMLVLEEYLTAMVSVVEHHGGTIGDFIGDCIMAFWNSPLDQANHAQLAVDTAFAMEQRLLSWNKMWEARGLPEIRIRIGINTGEVLSGNIGSPVKMKFGVVGDTVNLASRVEDLNKYYGTSCLITDSTYDAISYATICRLVDKVAVKGRKKQTFVYEPMAPKNTWNAEEVKHMADETTRMVSLYGKKEFEKVFDLAEEHLSHHPDDEVVIRLREKARQYLYEPPADDWNGINRMSEK